MHTVDHAKLKMNKLGDASAAGGKCTVCTAGEYKGEVGNADCTRCTGNSMSEEGTFLRGREKCDRGLHCRFLERRE